MSDTEKRIAEIEAEYINIPFGYYCNSCNYESTGSRILCRMCTDIKWLIAELRASQAANGQRRNGGA